MKKFIIRCPCCNNQIEVQEDDSGNTSAFLVDKEPLSLSELFQECGIELGVIEGGEK